MDRPLLLYLLLMAACRSIVIANLTTNSININNNNNNIILNNNNIINNNIINTTTTTNNSNNNNTFTITTNTITNTIGHPTQLQKPIQPPAKPVAKVCRGVHIRNDLKSFEQLRNCNIIDGPLTIALVTNQTNPYEPKDYENITFPELREITEYLLFFRVQGLSSLTKLFPNLTVIRGKELVSNYALIIYEMMHLQQISLTKLTDILRGSVRIENNPNLCYVTTVNWGAICKFVFTPHFIKDNKPSCNNRCPEHCRPWNTTTDYDASSSSISSTSHKLQGDVKDLGSEDNRFCWNNQVCHTTCLNNESAILPYADTGGGCCSHQCAGGCYQPDSADHCFSCRSYLQGNTCVEKCAPSLYEYKGRCLKEQECALESHPPPLIQQSHCRTDEPQTSPSNLKAVKLSNLEPGRCQTECPPGYEEDPTNKNKCKPCDKGKCRKICTQQNNDKPFMVTNVNSLRELSGCNVINGSLEISIKGGKNVLHELELAFQELEEIKGYLKITRSYPILTLGFLSRLKAINGSILDRGQYSLIMIDNPNLQELFLFNSSVSDQKQLNILYGKIFIHLNPKLCPHRIEKLRTYASVANWDDNDVSLHTNGDKEACNTQRLDVRLVHSSARLALIRFENFALKMQDARSLLYYLVNYREAPNGTVTMFDGRDGCNSQNDVWSTLEESPAMRSSGNETIKYQEVLIRIKPATRYALYVKTFTIRSGSDGASSDMIYFETAPDTPGIPKHLEVTATSHDTMIVSWSPPSKPNGLLEKYSVTITRLSEYDDIQSHLDVCDSIANRDKFTQTITKEEQPHQTLVTDSTNNQSNKQQQSSSSNEPNTCSRNNVDSTDSDLQVEVVTFQDMIIDIVYLKQPCPLNATKSLRKRSIDHYDFNESEESSSDKQKTKIPQDPPMSTAIAKQVIASKTTILNKSRQAIIKPSIRFNHTMGKTMADVPVNKSVKSDARLSYIIDGLEHFSLYQIEVVACHGDVLDNNTELSTKYSKCSIQAITVIRTQPIDEADRVPRDSISHYPPNETSSDHVIMWTKPPAPNGRILAFRVRYRIKNANAEIWTEACINMTAYNHDGGITLSIINPGTYLLSIQTISMYSSQRYWTEEIEFEVPQNYLLSPVVMTIVIIVGLILLAFGVASGTYYYQKRRHELTSGLIYASVNPDYIQYDPDEWEVDKSKVVIGDQIGKGSYGMVYKGLLATEKGTLNCAIKTVPPTSTAKQRMDFLREASIMKQFDTHHVVKLMGVVSTTTPVYVIMEYMEHGDLKSFLRIQREIHQRENKPLVDGIYLMAAQIADGMAYLSSKKFVHRDLAARNCMVGANRVVKIGDFGLARDIYANDYYRRDTNVRLPVRWMAPESLGDNIYTTASDVWSYGIVVWEMVTFSAYPYQGQSNEEVMNRVIQGLTMSRPENCPDKLHYIMQRCWSRLKEHRPTFNFLVEYLLPETEDKLYPNCFYRKPKTEGDSVAAQPPLTEDYNAGAESYPLISWPANRANGLTNGVNHVQSDSQQA